LFRPNGGRFKIKTPTGYENFEGVQKKTVDVMWNITFTDNTNIRCSGKHAFLTHNGFTHAEKLSIGDEVSGKKIEKITSEVGKFEVYDPVGVDKHNTYYSVGVISHNTEFLGSSNTLINPGKIGQLMAAMEEPIAWDNDAAMWEMPIAGHTYCMTVDVSEGVESDYSAFQIIDVTSIPYKVVCRYMNRKIPPFTFPAIIVNYAKKYNDAFVLVEINTIGLQVADILHYELSYENLIKIEMKGKQGQQNTPGFKKKIAFGLKHNKQTKAIGCANFKTLVESDKLIIKDEVTIKEFTTFVLDKNTYKAEPGSNDDATMCLVNFGWLTSQKYFKENINNNIRKVLQEEQLNIMDSDVVPFGIIDNGIDDPFDDGRDANGDKWVTDRERIYVFDNIEWDTLTNKHRL